MDEKKAGGGDRDTKTPIEEILGNHPNRWMREFGGWIGNARKCPWCGYSISRDYCEHLCICANTDGTHEQYMAYKVSLAELRVMRKETLAVWDKLPDC